MPQMVAANKPFDTKTNKDIACEFYCIAHFACYCDVSQAHQFYYTTRAVGADAL